MAQDEKKYYFIADNWKRVNPDENDGRDWAPENQYITTNLSILFAKYSDRFRDVDHFAEAMLGNDVAQRIAGFTLREATEEDLKDFYDDLEVIEAIEAYREADRIADETKVASQVTVAKWFSENVKTQQQSVDFFKLHRLNPFNFTSWIIAAEASEAEDGTKWTASPASVSALFEYWTSRNLVLKGDQKTKANNSKAYQALKARVDGN